MDFYTSDVSNANMFDQPGPSGLNVEESAGHGNAIVQKYNYDTKTSAYQMNSDYPLKILPYNGYLAVLSE